MKSAPKPAPKKPPTKPAVAKKAVAKKAVAKHGSRADLGAPIHAFFEKQPATTRPILEALRELVEAAAPEAESSLKWGMPFFTINGVVICALGGFKAHVNLVLSGPPGTYADPAQLLEPEGKTGRHLKLTSLEALPKKAVQGWLRTATERARAGASD